MAFKAQISTRRPAVRRDLLESLESRQLMAAFDANFNFQPASSATPSGYIADVGHKFNWRAGHQFGWNVDNSAQHKDRHTSADARYDTFAFVGKAGGASKWEVSVPNGSYNVKLTAGDPSDLNSHYGIALEGKTVLSERPHKWNKWSEASATVNVTDGRLTLTGAPGAWNNKITSIQISGPNSTGNQGATGSGVRPPSAPSWTAAGNATRDTAVVQWGDGSNNESGFIIEKSTNGRNFTEAGRVGANNTRFTAGNLNAGTRYTFRVRAFNVAGMSLAGPLGTATTVTGQNPTTPAPAKTGWTGATLDGGNAIKLAWGDVSNETGYAVQRSTDGQTFSDVGRVGANVTHYRDGNLASGKKYYYRIQSYNNGGTANGSTVNATTPSTSTARPPSAIGWLGATANGQNGARLNWGDVANETGYVIERGTGNGSFSEAGRVSANVTSFNAGGLNAGSKYVFRVKAFNNSGTSAASAAQTIWTANPTWSPPPTNNGGNHNQNNNNNNNNQSIGNSHSLSGLSANGAGTNAHAYKSTLDDVGIKNVRIWYSTDNWNNGVNKWFVDRAASYKAAGFKVMLAVLNPNPTDAGTAKRFFERLVGNATLRNSVDYWQVNNEPNHPQFWRGSLQQYVQNNLKPASEALRAAGETVVGAGPTWDAGALRQMVSYGYNNHVDYAAFHPYGNSAAQVLERAAAAKAAVGNKPIMFTEWNITGLSGNVGNWTSQLNTAAAGLSRIGAMSYYFALFSSHTDVGRGGVLNANGTRNSAFYDTVKGWLD